MEHSCKCCDLILSLVQLLFSFVSIRITKFSFSEKAVLATQSSMCLHDNKISGMYLNDFEIV